MEIAPAVQIAAFAVFAFLAVAGALGMTTTMSMFRSGIFLMSSFIGVAGLFVLLLADLLGLLQVMMYTGGMLVMILFMVLFSNDPGGAMMTGMMELPLLERWFSKGLVHGDGMEHDGEGGEAQGGEDDSGGHGDMDMGGMQMEPMFIVSNKKPAAILALLVVATFAALVLFRPAWPVQSAIPDPHSARRVGDLLMGKYMIAFEGAGLMILLGIFGAVFVSRPGTHPDPTERERIRAAVDEDPVPIAADVPQPRYRTALAEQPEQAGEKEAGSDEQAEQHTGHGGHG